MFTCLELFTTFHVYFYESHVVKHSRHFTCGEYFTESRRFTRRECFIECWYCTCRERVATREHALRHFACVTDCWTTSCETSTDSHVVKRVHLLSTFHWITCRETFTWFHMSWTFHRMSTFHTSWTFRDMWTCVATFHMSSTCHWTICHETFTRFHMLWAIHLISTFHVDALVFGTTSPSSTLAPLPPFCSLRRRYLFRRRPLADSSALQYIVRP